jgi:regulatory protein
MRSRKPKPPRPPDPVDVAVRALRARDRSSAELDARLERYGVDEADRVRALETVGRLGYLDDERFAHRRAEELAARGSGDALIRDDLERRGLAAELIDAGLAQLPPERERAARVAAARGPSPKTARYLAARGFSEEAVEALVAREE